MSALGSLVVKLALEYAQYTQGLDKSSQQAMGFGKNIQDSMDKAMRSTKQFLTGVATGAIAAVASYKTVTMAIDTLMATVDRLDAFDDASQRLGLTRRELQEFTHVARMSGVGVDVLAASTRELSTRMFDAAAGNKQQAETFRALGIEVKGADGQLRGTTAVMGDIIDRLSKMGDGAEKTALAKRLLGKAGTDMISVINGGRDAFEAAAEEAHRFGLVMGDEVIIGASELNDNMDRLRLLIDGTWNQVAAGAIPVLSKFTELLVDAASGTGSLNQKSQELYRDGSFFAWAKESAIYLTYLMDGVQGTWRWMNALTDSWRRVQEATHKPIVNLWKAWGDAFTGDFSGAWDNITSMFSGSDRPGSIAENFAALDKPLVGSTIRAELEAMQFVPGALDGIATSAGGTSGALSGLSTELDKTVQALTTLMGTLDSSIAALELELQTGEKLTAMQRTELQMMKLLEAGKTSLSEKDQILARMRMDMALSLEAEINAMREHEAALKSAAAARDQLYTTLERETDSSRDAVAQQHAQNEAIGKTKAELDRLQVARLREKAAMLERQALIAQDIDWSGAMSRELRNQAAATLELADAMEEGIRRGAVHQAAEAARDEWARTAESIYTSITDALMRGFEDGKGFVQNLVDTVRNMFNTLVLRPVVQAVVSPVAGGLAGLLGGGNAMAGQAGGGAGMLGNASSLLGLGGAAGAFGGGVMSGLTAWGAGGSVTGLLGSGSALFAGGIANGLGVIAGALGPIALGIGALAAAFGLFRRTRTVGTGITGTLGEGDISNYELTRRSGSLFGGPSYRLHDRGVSDVSDDIQRTYGDLREATAQMAEMLGLDTAEAVRAFVMEIGSEIHPDTGGLGLALEGMSDSEREQAIADMFSGANEALAELALGTNEYTREGELASQALQRMASSLTVVNDLFADLDHRMFDVSLAGADLASMLADTFGGLENLTQGLGQYYQLFYSEEERAANITRRMTEEFAAFGAVVPDSMEAYRAMVESLDLSTDAGREFYEVMIRFAPAFAGLRDAAADAVANIVETAQQARNVNTPISSIREWNQPVDNSGRLQTLNERMRGLQQLQSGIDRTLDAMRPQDAASQMFARAEAQAEITAALAIGRAGGSLAGMDLSRSLGVLSEPSQGLFGNAADWRFDQARTANELAALRDLAGEELTDVQQQIDLLQKIADNTFALKAPGMLITKGGGIPAFAAGGSHAGGWALVGEGGPELAYLPPARVYSHAQSQRMMDVGAVVAALNALSQQQRALLYPIVKHTMRTAQTLDKWQRFGMPQETEA